MIEVPALELRGVGRSFGALRALDDVSFSVASGARHAVIGPNGAGKSTLFAVVAGASRGAHGGVLLHGREVSHLREHRRVRAGVVRTFQHSSLFLSATALENVVLALQRQHGVAWSMLRPVRSRRTLLAQGRELLDRVQLAGPDRAAGELSHGERRQLEVALALACRPRLLLFDEPVAGMSAAETAGFVHLIRTLPTEITVMLVEHDLDVVFDLADTVTVLHLGRHLETGPPRQIRASDQVQTAYLGAADASDLFPPEVDDA